MRIAALLRTSGMLLGVVSAAMTAPACGEPSEAPAREVELTSVLAAADEPLLRVRPALEAGKLTRMSLGATDFFRGGVPLYRHDVRDGTSTFGESDFALPVPLVPSVGDAHLENFGTLVAGDGTLALEPNDFDAADRTPYLWDLRRLAAGVALAALLSNEDDPAAREEVAAHAEAIARRAAEGYARGIDAARAGEPRTRVDGPGDNPILRDLFERSERDRARRPELEELTELRDGARRLRRGPIDPEDDQNVLQELPAFARVALPETLRQWQSSLIRPVDEGYLTILDAARELGSGVASWPRVRALVLVDGPTSDPGDDVLLEVKEIADSTIGGLYPPGLFWNSVQERVVGMSRLAWTRADAAPLWGAASWVGLPVQIREESEAQKTLRIARLTKELGTAEAIGALAALLGQQVARVHTAGQGGDAAARAIHERIARGPEAFLDEQASFGAAYAAQALLDHRSFVRALHRVGLRLGLPEDANDAPTPDFAALLGTPPPPPVLPP